MKNTYVLLTCVLIASASAVIGLHLLSRRHQPSDNGFTRFFSPNPLRSGPMLDMGYNSYYFAGASPRHLYFANTTAPLHLVSTTTNLADSHHIRLSLHALLPSLSSNVRVQVDSPDFYMLDGIRPTIMRGTLNDWTARHTVADTLFFTEAAPLTPTSFAVRVAAGAPPNYILGKITRQSGLTLAPGALVKQVDGLFCTDGMLHYARDLNTIVYVYYYRNEFICMDTSLNIRYRGRTIDTVSHARIKIAEIKADHSIVLAAPPLIVNSQSSVSGRNLFVHSNLKASNESEEIFQITSVIDVYDLTDGRYQYSFYIPNVEGKKLSGFDVAGETVVTRFGGNVYIYRLLPLNKQGQHQ